MRGIINFFTTLQFLALGSILGSLIANIIFIYAFSNPNGIQWYTGLYEECLKYFALIGVFAVIKGICRFIDERI